MTTKSKTATAKKPGAKGGTATARKSQVLTEPGLLQAAEHKAGLLGLEEGLLMTQTPDAVQVEATQVESEPDEAAPSENDEVIAPSSAPDDNNLTLREESDGPYDSIQRENRDEQSDTAPLPSVSSDSVGTLPKKGVAISPLAQRMLAQAAQRSKGRRTRANHQGLGKEFDEADDRVYSLKEQLIEAQKKVAGSIDTVIDTQIKELRNQLRTTRGTTVAGIEPFNDAIAAARQALREAKTAKAAYLSGQGVTVITAEAGHPSLRQQLRALRAQKRAALDEAGGEEVVRLRAELRAAKVERKAACLRAHALREAANTEVVLDSPKDRDEVSSEEGVA